jgi:hypothetical protein
LVCQGFNNESYSVDEGKNQEKKVSYHKRQEKLCISAPQAVVYIGTVVIKQFNATSTI